MICAGTSRARLREMYNELGDMGDVAQACRHTQASTRLRLAVMHSIFKLNCILLNQLRGQ